MGAAGVPVLVSRTPVMPGAVCFEVSASVIGPNRSAERECRDCNDASKGWVYRISQKKIKKRCDYLTRKDIIYIDFEDHNRPLIKIAR